MNYKPFSQSDYNQYDLMAKIKAATFLVSTGNYYLKTMPDKQVELLKTADFIIYHKTFGKTLVETETKLVWTKSGVWEGYSTIHIPHRKNKSLAHLFIMFNKTYDTLLITKMDNILKSPVIMKNCQCSNVNTESEPFFELSLSKVQFHKFVNDKWECIKKIKIEERVDQILNLLETLK